MEEEAVEPQGTTKRRMLPRLKAVKAAEGQEGVKSAEDEWLEAFEEFWKEYPRRICKYVARKSFLRVRPWNQQMCDDIFAGLGRWRAYWSSADTELRFIPHASTWLNQHRWEDEPE